MGCHTLFGEGAYYAPELTKVVERRGKPWLRLFLKDPEKMFPGQRKMVNYQFNDKQIEDVIAFLESLTDEALLVGEQLATLRDISQNFPVQTR